MGSILIVILVIVSIAVIGLVLLQHGKGADIGASFGSGASSTVFGSQGSTSFLAKFTFGLAAVFFIICIVLTNMASRAAKGEVVVVAPQTPAQQNIVPPTTSNGAVPAVPEPAKQATK